MAGTTVGKEALIKTLLTLFEEGFFGSLGKGTWYVDSEPECGFLGTIGKLDATAASRPLSPGDPLTVASHVDHVRFALSLASGQVLEDEELATGSFGLVSHTAWHLGAVRQGLGLIRAPGNS